MDKIKLEKEQINILRRILVNPDEQVRGHPAPTYMDPRILDATRAHSFSMDATFNDNRSLFESIFPTEEDSSSKELIKEEGDIIWL